MSVSECVCMWGEREREIMAGGAEGRLDQDRKLGLGQPWTDAELRCAGSILILYMQ